MNFTQNISVELYNNNNNIRFTGTVMSDLKPWIVAAIIADGLVISLNIIQLAFLLRKCNRLVRTEYLLLSLCISDMICGVTMFGHDTFNLKRLIDVRKIYSTSLESMVLDCVTMFFIFVSNFHIIALAVERLVAVSFPMKYNVFTTLKCKVLTISFVWIFALLLAPSVTVLQKIDREARKSDSQSQMINGSVLLIACIIVFSIYMTLFFALWRREQQMRELLAEELHSQLRDRKTTMICLLFGVAFLVCILPHTLASLNNKLYHHSFNILITANQFLNPLIYFFKIYAERKRAMSAASQCRLLPREITFIKES